VEELARKKADVKEDKAEKSKKKPNKDKYVDPEKLLDEYLDDAVTALSLSNLQLERDEYKELIEEPFVAAVGQVKSKPKLSTIVNRLLANKEGFMEYLAMKLVRIREIEKMTDEQLEFVVYNTKKGIVALAPQLYKEAVKRGRSDLVDILRYEWDTYGIRSPIRCTKCGFNSIMPDFTCRVCGYEMSMKEVKAQINLIGLLKDYSNLDPDGFKEILSTGYFYYTATGVVPPSKFKPEPGAIFFEIVLTSSEKKALSSTGSTPR
jgi:predicted Zn-ribbon and HTH transcriptional regulator